MLDEGHIKLHRSILSWEWYKDRNTRDTFMHLLLIANWKPSYFMGRTIERGQCVTSRKRLSAEIGLSEQELRTSINRLKSTGEITIETTSKYSVVTIIKYGEYQGSNQPGNQRLTSVQPASNQHSTTYKESNKAINNTATAAREGALAMLSQFYEANGFGMIPRHVFDKMDDWLCRGTDADLLLRCMEEAAGTQNRSWNLVESILGRCENQGIFDRAGFDAEKARHSSARRKTVSPAEGKSGARRRTNAELAEELFGKENGGHDGDGNGAAYFSIGAGTAKPPQR